MTTIDWSAIEPALWACPPESTVCNGFFALKLRFLVPLQHGDPRSKEQLELHAELVYGPGPALPSPAHAGSLYQTLARILSARDPGTLAVYLCGGPGDGNPAFANPELNRTLLKVNNPVLYVDYRGTGRSSPVTAASLRARGAGGGAGDGGGAGPADPLALAAYLSHFRQDHIAADLEAIRLRLQPAVKLSLVCQSFGGWVAMTYLSFAPHALQAVFLAGGMPPVGRTPDEVYAALYRRLARANEEYYARYPEDVARVMLVASWLARPGGRGGERLPDGQRLSARGFLTLGRHFGRGAEGMEYVHSVVERFEHDIRCCGGITERSLAEFVAGGGTGFRLPERPLYAVLHEAIYCSGPGVASEWAAQRVGRQLPGRHFAWLRDDFFFCFPKPEACEPLYFSGEMIYEFMLRDAGPALEPFIDPARVLARFGNWTELYDVEQMRRNEVLVRPLIYPQDLFLDYDFSMAAARGIRKCCVARAPFDWTHGSIKTRPKEVCRSLFSLEKDWVAAEGYAPGWLTWLR